MKRYTVSPERNAAIFTVKPGENPHLELASQFDQAKPWELAALAMMRQGDEGQVRAMEMLLLSKATRTAHTATIAAGVAAVAAVASAVVSLWT